MDLADEFHEIQRDNAHFQTQVLEYFRRGFPAWLAVQEDPAVVAQQQSTHKIEEEEGGRSPQGI